MNENPSLRFARARTQLGIFLCVVPAIASSGCDLLKSAQATTIVAGLLIATPEVKLAGQFNIDSEVAATSFVGERSSATSDDANPVTGANVAITFAGNNVALREQMNPEGFYLADSIEDMGLAYADGQTYTFVAKLPGDTVDFGGSVTAPTRLNAASLTFTPEPQGTMIADVKSHPKSTDLTVAWTQQNGRYAYVTVVRGDSSNPDRPEVVFDNQPRTASEIIKFVVGTPPTSITIPATTFARDGIYAVIVVTMDRGDPKTNTFLGSPILAGSGAAMLLSVGNP